MPHQLVPLAEQASLCHFLTTLPEHESGVCGGPRRGRESSSHLGSASVPDTVLEGTQRSSAAPLKTRGADGTHQPRRSPLTARWLALAPPIGPFPLGPDGVPPARRELGRRSRPSAQVEVESDRGQDVADGVKCVVRGDHAGDEGQASQGDRKHDRSAAVHPRRRSTGPGRRPAGTIAAEVETAGGRTTSRSGTSSASRAPYGPHPTSAAPLPRRPFSPPPVGRRTMLSHTVAYDQNASKQLAQTGTFRRWRKVPVALAR